MLLFFFTGDRLKITASCRVVAKTVKTGHIILEEFSSFCRDTLNGYKIAG